MSTEGGDLDAAMAKAALANVELFTIRDQFAMLHQAAFPSALQSILRAARLRKGPDYYALSDASDSLLSRLQPALAALVTLSQFKVRRAEDVARYGKALEGALIAFRQLMLEASISGDLARVSPDIAAFHQFAFEELTALHQELSAHHQDG